MEKVVLASKKIILTGERCAKLPISGQNTQHFTQQPTTKSNTVGSHHFSTFQKNLQYLHKNIFGSI